jgi:hypothetical protein
MQLPHSIQQLSASLAVDNPFPDISQLFRVVDLIEQWRELLSYVFTKTAISLSLQERSFGIKPLFYALFYALFYPLFYAFLQTAFSTGGITAFAPVLFPFFYPFR